MLSKPLCESSFIHMQRGFDLQRLRSLETRRGRDVVCADKPEHSLVKENLAFTVL